MNKVEYNGWTNYETWAVNLWLTNEEGSYRYWTEQAGEAWANAESGEYEWQTKEKQAAYALAESLKSELEEGAEQVASGNVYADLLNAALSEVNWTEIAEAFLETAKEEAS